VDIEAMLVPILALAIQAGYAAAHEGRVPLLSFFGHSVTLPIMLLLVIGVGLISNLLLRALSRDRSARAVVFVSCVAAFAGIACFATATVVK
jgi:hypothetical protein